MRRTLTPLLAIASRGVRRDVWDAWLRRSVTRGALEVTSGRPSIACSREQIGQFWSKRLWRQNFGTD